MRHTASILMTCALVLGLLLPRMGAVLVELVPGVTQAVICTGHEMITLTLDAEGQPIEMPEHDSPHCLQAEPPAPGVLPVPTWQRLAATPRLGAPNLARAPARPQTFVDHPPTHGPPAVALL